MSLNNMITSLNGNFEMNLNSFSNNDVNIENLKSKNNLLLQENNMLKDEINKLKNNNNIEEYDI